MTIQKIYLNQKLVTPKKNYTNLLFQLGGLARLGHLRLQSE